MLFAGAALDAVSPATVYATDTSQAGREKRAERGQKSAIAGKKLLRADNPAALRLEAQIVQYDFKNTKRMQSITDGYFDIVFGNPEPGTSMVIGDESYDAEELQAMSKSERNALANRWLEGNNVREEFESFRAWEADFLKRNPEYRDFKQYKGWISDLSDTVEPQQLRASLRELSPYYAQVEDERRRKFLSEGQSLAEIEESLDKALYYSDTYFALKGMDPYSRSNAKQRGLDPVTSELGLPMMPWQKQEAQRGGDSKESFPRVKVTDPNTGEEVWVSQSDWRGQGIEPEPTWWAEASRPERFMRAP